MNRRTYLLMLFLFTCSLFAQDMPHGDNFEMDCENCHSDESWAVDLEELTFDHQNTGFALLGAHSSVQCTDCHESLIFNHIGTTCIDCHSDIHKGELGIQCESCHTPRSWENRMEAFEIHNQTGFPLVGVHAILDCQACHQTEQHREFANTSIQCKSCHLENYMQTLNPAHQQAAFDLTCENCHLLNASSWKQAVFDHSVSFPLSGGHTRLECNDCHSSMYQGTNVECISCHESDYLNTSEPNHQQFRFLTLCETCHTTASWSATTFDHLQVSAFELRGIHAIPSAVKCLDCHVDNQLVDLPQDCIDCHKKDYDESKNPNHVAGQFSTDCLTCHNENSWQPAEFDHNLTNFPLTGAHLTLECISCHENGQFIGTPVDCFSCHEDDFNAVNDPNHLTNNFDHDCIQCHSTTAWDPATFNHTQTSFTLTGAHISLNCAECHSNGYTNTPTECIACHEKDYNSTSDPNHSAAQFPTNCQDCHNTSVWDPTDFDHDGMYFPIYTGEHHEAWNTCSDCHVNSADYKVFECINCHEHNQTEMDKDHKDEKDYTYDSPSCLRCHPDGKSD